MSAATETQAGPSSRVADPLDVDRIRRDFPILHRTVRENRKLVVN